MKNMAFEVVSNLFVVVHTANPPSDEEWDRYVAAGVASSKDKRFLVFTDGGAPTSAQRKRLYDALKGKSAITAVISGNAFVRTTVFALSVLNPQVKVFPPDAINDAYRYLHISEVEGRAVTRVIKKLQDELGLDSAARAGL